MLLLQDRPFASVQTKNNWKASSKAVFIHLIKISILSFVTLLFTEFMASFLPRDQLSALRFFPLVAYISHKTQSPSMTPTLTNLLSVTSILTGTFIHWWGCTPGKHGCLLLEFVSKSYLSAWASSAPDTVSCAAVFIKPLAEQPSPTSFSASLL